MRKSNLIFLAILLSLATACKKSEDSVISQINLIGKWNVDEVVAHTVGEGGAYDTTITYHSYGTYSFDTDGSGIRVEQNGDDFNYSWTLTGNELIVTYVGEVRIFQLTIDESDLQKWSSSYSYDYGGPSYNVDATYSLSKIH